MENHSSILAARTINKAEHQRLMFLNYGTGEDF